MTKYSHFLLLTGMLLLAGCQSVEQLSIDYLLPADISFPSDLKRVAIVNNMPETSDNKPIFPKGTRKEQSEIAGKTNCYNGIGSIAAEALAQSLANENYFEEVVICDSALRARDMTPRETMLSAEEVNRLTTELDADFLISLENIQIGTVRKVTYLPDWGTFHGTVDAKVYSTVRVYLPQRNIPMVTLCPTDSVFWEEFGSETYVQTRLIKEEEVVKQASEFAGSVPVRRLLPHWEKAGRYLFCGGNVNMRDAAVYARENKWNTAVELWAQTYNTEKGKKKMMAAYNAAVGYEMLDSITTATQWAQKAQAEARVIEKIEQQAPPHLNGTNNPYYLLTTLYVAELEKRKEGLPRLIMQMKRFNEH